MRATGSSLSLSLRSEQAKILRVSRVSSSSDLRNIAPEWQYLFAMYGNGNVFLTWEWISHWWELFGQNAELQLLTVRNTANELVGIAPLMICMRRVVGTNLRSLRFMGSGQGVWADYCDVLCSQEMRDDVIDSILSYLRSHQRDWDVAELWNVLENSNIYHRISQVRDFWDGAYHIEPDQCAPYISLSDSWEEYVAGLSSNLRSVMRKRSRRLKNTHKVRFVKLDEGINLDDALESFFTLHKARWKSRGKSGILDAHEHAQQFHKRIAFDFYRNGWLHIFLLEVDDRPVASLYGYRLGDTHLQYNSGYEEDWSRFGVLKQLFALTIEDAINSGLREFDFMKGDESYKFEWTRKSRSMYRLLLWSDTRRGHSFRTMWTMRRHTRKKLSQLSSGFQRVLRRKAHR